MVATLGKWTLNFRLITVAVASLAMAVGDPPAALPLALVAAGLLNLGVLWWWARLAPWLARHPFALVVDLSLTAGVLLLTGVDGPLLYYALGTGFFAGVLYGRGGGLAYSVMVLACYLFAAAAWAPLREQPLGFHELIAVPALLLLAALGASAVRSLLLQRAAQHEELSQARAQTAVSEDRARLAREVHDTLGKTLHGLSLRASGLAQWADRAPERAGEEARGLAAAAEQAAREARDLLTTLRTHRLDQPLPQAVEDLVRAWDEAMPSVQVEVHAGEVPALPAEVRHELFSVCSEALRNVQRHANLASRVTVALGSTDDASVTLTVEDDGAGMDLPADGEACDTPDALDALARRGHYGLVGIAERARRVGGQAAFRSEPGRGFCVRMEVPTRAAAGAPLEEERT